MTAQIILNGVAAASAYWLVGLSFAVIYRLEKFFDMTPAAAYVVGAYVTFALGTRSGAAIWLSICLGIVSATALGACIHYGIFGARSVTGSRPGERFLISLGLVVVAQGAIAVLCGDDTKNFHWPIATPLPIASGILTGIQIATIASSVALGVTAICLERITTAGLGYRAMACDRQLSRIVGVPTNKVRFVAIVSSGAIAGAAGILAGLDIGLTPGMGFRAILMGMVGAIVGGVASFKGVVVGAVLLACLQVASAYWLSSSWQDAIVFLALILWLLINPTGYVGSRLRKATI